MIYYAQSKQKYSLQLEGEKRKEGKPYSKWLKYI